jgi:8-oxo-dGTP pyrophosphatase MutT (NUDIX family)
MKKIRRQRVSVVVVDNGRILGFQGEDPATGCRNFFVPGGAIEEGETLEAAAVRETLEETGFAIAIIPGIVVESRYDFSWNGAVYDCSTTYFAGQILNREAAMVNDADYHRGVEWRPICDIPKDFAYHHQILESILDITRRMQDLG